MSTAQPVVHKPHRNYLLSTVAVLVSIVVFVVPFAFIVGSVRMPPGDYVIRESTDAPDLLSIESKDGRQTAFILAIPLASDQRAETSELVFEKFAGEHFLSRVKPSDGDWREILLTPAIMERELGR